MAIKPALILAAVGAGYFLTKKDSKTSTQTTNTPKGDFKDPLKDLPPPPPKDDNNPDLPPINPNDKPEPKGDGNPNMKVNLEKFYGNRFFVTGNEQPANPSTVDLWVSESCNSWGIGTEFPGLLPEKVIFPDSKNIDSLISALDWWAIVGKEYSPVPIYYAHLPSDLPFRNWARTLIEYYTNCGKSIPQRKDFKTFKEFQTTLTKFEATPVGKLYRELYRMIGEAMLEDWEKNYPDAVIKDSLTYWSLWSIRNYPNLSLTNKTDEAYKKAFENDSDAPKKLDPKKSGHQEYIDAWNFMYNEIKSIMNYIKENGDNLDPLA